MADEVSDGIETGVREEAEEAEEEKEDPGGWVMWVECLRMFSVNIGCFLGSTKQTLLVPRAVDRLLIIEGVDYRSKRVLVFKIRSK